MSNEGGWFLAVLLANCVMIYHAEWARYLPLFWLQLLLTKPPTAFRFSCPKGILLLVRQASEHSSLPPFSHHERLFLQNYAQNKLSFAEEGSQEEGRQPREKTNTFEWFTAAVLQLKGAKHAAHGFLLH